MSTEQFQQKNNGSSSPIPVQDWAVVSSAETPILHSPSKRVQPERNLPVVGEIQPAGSNRLVVLTPDQDMDEVHFSRDIWSFALSKKMDVVLVTIARNAEEIHSAQLRLATIGSMIRDPFVQVDSEVIHTRSWIKAAKKISRSDDAVLCPTELTLAEGLGKRRAMSEILSENLKLPVYTMSGYFADRQVMLSRVIRHVFYWFVLLAIFAGFFKVETSADLFLKGQIGQMVEFLIVLVEVGAIYFWTAVVG